jgi:hypothetical protein
VKSALVTARACFVLVRGGDHVGKIVVAPLRCYVKTGGHEDSIGSYEYSRVVWYSGPGLETCRTRYET